MPRIFPSAAVLRQKYALVSSLRSQGFAIGSYEDGDKPGAGDLFLVADGETPPAAARTVILSDEGRLVQPSRDGNPARVAFGNEASAIGNGFVRALLCGPEVPTAADPESLALHALAERVAAANITVLINGPTGTGKEVLARAIHLNSDRRDGPFIAVNCAALPETMLEALLFGHQKGAFTGASSGGEGFFRAANGGTLLLDEIAEMPLTLQSKLLRALQEREVIPIGATQAESIDVRVIACANRELHGEVAAGRFRADLYYRLSVFPLETRMLAERRQDIPPLIATLILRHVGSRKQVPWPSAGAVDKLIHHDWPGNVRELENVIQRALLFAAGDTIEASHIVFDRAPDMPRETAKHLPSANAGQGRPDERIPGDPRDARCLWRQPDRDRKTPWHFRAHVALPASPRRANRVRISCRLPRHERSRWHRRAQPCRPGNGATRADPRTEPGASTRASRLD